MKMMSGFNLRFLLAGCALAMGIGASSAAMAEPKNCTATCYYLNVFSPAAALACMKACRS
jgi:hypothetical protein